MSAKDMTKTNKISVFVIFFFKRIIFGVLFVYIDMIQCVPANYDYIVKKNTHFAIKVQKYDKDTLSGVSLI